MKKLVMTAALVGIIGGGTVAGVQHLTEGDEVPGQVPSGNTAIEGAANFELPAGQSDRLQQRLNGNAPGGFGVITDGNGNFQFVPAEPDARQGSSRGPAANGGGTFMIATATP